MEKIFLFFFCTIMVFSCKKDSEAEELYHTPAFIECYSNTMFDCSGNTPGEEYFSCQLDGKDCCRSVGEDEYVSYYMPTLIIVTNGPSLALSQAKGRYCLEFGIKSASNSQDEQPKLVFNYISPKQATPREMLDSAFKVGPLRLRNKNNLGDTTDVFDLRVGFQCSTNSNSYYDIGFESWAGAQRDPSLECTRYNRVETDTQVLYDITLKFQCDLWHGDHPDTQRLWRRLENGVLAMRFVVDK
jgi:hypothetical protein